MDKAGKLYWDQVWDGAPIPEPVNPRASTSNNHLNRCFHAAFTAALKEFEGKHARLVEVGCARSVWLPYFAREFGFEVSGIDYSDLGCEQARAILGKNNVRGDVYCCDLFSPPSEIRGTFDVVTSFGVVEHFQNTSDCLKALAALVKPGGLLITTIPNLSGWTGFLQKRLNYPVYTIHVPMTAEQLANAHSSAGLKVEKCEYFMDVNWNVVNLNGFKPAFLERFLVRFFSGLTKITWRMNRWKFLPANRRTSPYIFCAARKAL